MHTEKMSLDAAVRTIDEVHALVTGPTAKAAAATPADPVAEFCRVWAVVRPVLVALSAIGGAAGLLFPPLLKAAPVLAALVTAGDAVCSNRPA
jgi:hypothetical protein